MQVPIKNFEDKYLISDSGEVFSLVSKRNIKTGKCTSGYSMAKLFDSYCPLTTKRVYKYIRVHRLVASHFIPNPNPARYTQVNHIDGNKQNNHIYNLEWVSPAQNMQHAVATGLFVIPPILSKEQVVSALDQYIDGIPLKILMKTFNVSKRLLEWIEECSINIGKHEKFLERQMLNTHLASKERGKVSSQAVLQKDTNGVLVKKWDSMIDAAKALGLGQGNISNVIAGRSKSCGGFLWEKV